MQIKVGYVPEATAVKYLTADQRYLVADWAIVKVILYFGELIDKAQGQNLYASEPDYAGMFRLLQTGLRIDPYDVDAYYFAQAVFTWDVGRYREVNNMLEYGMKYRTWDYQLPFFAGFNAGYFLKDYKKAGEYMKKAAEMAQEQQFATLAARYFYEANDYNFAIVFLKTMRKTAKDDKEKKFYDFRLRALVAAKEIQDAVNSFRSASGRLPGRLDELATAGYLKSVPADPYGGSFYLDENGKVRTTSNFTFAGARASRKIDR
ncbi:MAG TPA: hypothetical protein VI389_03535 [Geobacteraceae bacterium]